MTTEEKWERSTQLLHAVQSGIAMTIEKGSTRATPKHLRVGVDNSIIMHSAICKLLFAKGIITEDEYLDQYIELLEEEVDKEEKTLSEVFGADIRLG
jgi:DNA-binding ferritin-like protein (Dps family)